MQSQERKIYITNYLQDPTTPPAVIPRWDWVAWGGGTTLLEEHRAIGVRFGRRAPAHQRLDLKQCERAKIRGGSYDSSALVQPKMLKPEPQNCITYYWVPKITI